MSTTAASILGAIIAFQTSGVIFIAYSLSRTRERLARVEQRLEDKA